MTRPELVELFITYGLVSPNPEGHPCSMLFCPTCQSQKVINDLCTSGIIREEGIQTCPTDLSKKSVVSNPSVRTWMATMAMNGFLSIENPDSPECVARCARQYVDALLAELESTLPHAL